MTRRSARRDRAPYCVFYATRTALVWATSEWQAFDVFIDTVFPRRASGRVAPPFRSEVNIRRLTADDRGWIEEFDGPAAREFIAALEQATPVGWADPASNPVADVRDVVAEYKRMAAQ